MMSFPPPQYYWHRSYTLLASCHASGMWWSQGKLLTIIMEQQQANQPPIATGQRHKLATICILLELASEYYIYYYGMYNKSIPIECIHIYEALQSFYVSRSHLNRVLLFLTTCKFECLCGPENGHVSPKPWRAIWRDHILFAVTALWST
jgi:hypothetical protein